MTDKRIIEEIKKDYRKTREWANKHSILDSFMELSAVGHLLSHITKLEEELAVSERKRKMSYEDSKKARETATHSRLKGATEVYLYQKAVEQLRAQIDEAREALELALSYLPAKDGMRTGEPDGDVQLMIANKIKQALANLKKAVEG